MTTRTVEKIVPIRIHSVSNGYFVAVGCKRFVFETIESLINAIHDYLTSPESFHKGETITKDQLEELPERCLDEITTERRVSK